MSRVSLVLRLIDADNPCPERLGLDDCKVRILLRVISLVTGLAVALTALSVGQFAASGELAVLAESGVLGVATLIGWFTILVAGPVASVQLWRLRRTGLFLTALLGIFVVVYYLVGITLRAPGAPFAPVVVAVLVNSALVALLLSSPAKRACAAQDSAVKHHDCI